MSNSRANFHAGKAAAALVASQRRGAGVIASRGETCYTESQQQPSDVFLFSVKDMGTRAAVALPHEAHQDARERQPGAGAVEVALRCDAELARIGVALHQSSEFRLWIIQREMTRQTGSMAFTRAQIRTQLKTYGIPFSERSLSRWLHRGHERYWNIDSRAGLIYPASPVLVATRLIDYCKAHELYDLYITNHPGQRRDMYITVTGGNYRSFERRVYEAWMASRNNPSLSRWTLSRLWNRDAVSLRLLERDSRIEKLQNFAFCDLENSEYTPFDAEGQRRKDVHRVKIEGHYCWQWQISNTYFAPVTRQHHKRGISRRVFYTVKKNFPEIQATSASDAEAESLGSLNRTHRMFYSTNEKARSNAKAHGEAIRYVLLGREDGNMGLYEVSPDGKERFEFFSAAATMRRRAGDTVHSSAMCNEVVACPF